jgi:hypothetical protein
MVKSALLPEEDLLLTFASLGRRWECHPDVAQKRATKLGIPILKFNQRAFSVRLSDVLRAEEKIATQ